MLFSSSVILIVTGLFYITKKIIDHRTNFKIPENISKIIIGHSHPEFAYNDTLIKDFKNFSASGEAYFYTYYKLVPFINNNKNIKTVFIEFTNNQISEMMNGWIWDDRYLPFKYEIFGSYINSEGLTLLMEKNLKGVISGQLRLLKHNFKVIASNNYSFLLDRGGYTYSVKDSAEADLKKQKDETIDSINTPNISQYNLYYLEKIISFCRAKNLKVYFVRSPMHPKYSGRLNEPLFKNILKTRFDSVEFLDFKDYPITNAEFGDLEHLNYKGARRFSIWFNQLLNQGLLNQPNKQQFIDEKMNE